jgi:subtilisin family serine protease
MIGLVMSFAIGLAEAKEPLSTAQARKSAVKVAILDTGSNIAYKEGISLIDGAVRDYNGHGTLIASIIKEACPGAELYVIKVIGKDGLALSEEAVILGLRWAISRGVNIINISLRLKDSERLHQAIREAFEREIIIIAAAGNKTPRIGLSTQYAIRNTQYEEVAYPAKYPEVIAVGALNRYGKIYEASVRGNDVEIYCKGYKVNKAGTSIAAAYASGAIADIISKNPNFSVKELRRFIAQNGCPLMSRH